MTVFVRGTGRTFRGSGKGLVLVGLDFVGKVLAVGLKSGSETAIIGALMLGFGASGSEIENVGTLPFGLDDGSESETSGVLLSEGPEKEKLGTLP